MATNSLTKNLLDWWLGADFTKVIGLATDAASEAFLTAFCMNNQTAVPRRQLTKMHKSVMALGFGLVPLASIDVVLAHEDFYL